MASLFPDDVHSSDSEDDDYVPDGEVSSEDDDEEQLLPEDSEIETKKRAKKNREVPKAENEKDKEVEERCPVTEAPVDEKQRANDLFKSFLEEVEIEMKMQEQGRSYSPEELSDVNVGKKVDECSSNESIPQKPAFKIFDFAGEAISVPVDEKGTTSAIEKATTSVNGSSVSSGKVSDSDFGKSKDEDINKPNKPKGLLAVLDVITKKKSKLTTLQKTSLDWMKFKRQHGINEELRNYNKGKGGFIERKRFLERSDVRSYEIERDMRMAKRKKN